MARVARKNDSCSIQSVTQRSKQSLFQNDKDRDALLEILKQAQRKFNFTCYAYCLLDDHAFHLILDTHGLNISTVLQSISVAYAKYRGVKGKMFAGRFVSRSLHNTEELQTEIATIQKKVESPYNSYCFRDVTKVDGLNVQLDLSQTIYSEVIAPMDIDQARDRLKQWAEENQCDCDGLVKDKQLRNQCIRSFRKTNNISLKILGELFSISESSVSKIISEPEQSS